MKVYTAFERPGPPGQGSDSDVVLIKEGGSMGALFLPFVWPLYHGLWIVLCGQIITAVLIAAVVRYVPSGELIGAIVAGTAMALMGAQGNDLRRWTYGLRGYAFSGVVAAESMAEAEQRLFTALGPHIYLP